MDLETALATAKEAQEKAMALEDQLNKLKENNSSLIEEKRKETESKQAAEQAAKDAARELAKKNGDYDQILKSAEEERNKALETLSNYEKRIALKEIEALSMKLASEIAFDSDAAELLAEQFAKRLKYSEDGVKITNTKGELTFSTAEDLVKEFQATSKFKALLKGTQATGGRPITATGRPGSPQNIPNTIPLQERLHLAHEARNK